jgi:hypothetical protein
MLWGPTAYEVPHRPSRTGQSGWNESLPAGNMQVKSSARIFREHTLNVTDLQSVCHWIVTHGIIRAVQKLCSGVAAPNHCGKATHLRALSNSKSSSSSDVSGEACAVSLSIHRVIGFGDLESPHFVLEGCTLQPETLRGRSRTRDLSRRRF